MSLLPEAPACGVKLISQFHEDTAPSAEESFGYAIDMGKNVSNCGLCLKPSSKASGTEFLGAGSVNTMMEAETMAHEDDMAFAEQSAILCESRKTWIDTKPTSPWFLGLVVSLFIFLILFYIFVMRK